MMDGLIHFVYLHYLTKRNDSEFWRTFRERHPVPQKFEKVLQLIYENNLRYRDLQIVGMTALSSGQTLTFGLIDFYEICNGLELFKEPINIDGYENLTPSFAEYQEMMAAKLDSPMVTTHTDFLLGLRGPERVGSPHGPVCYCNKYPGFHSSNEL